MSEFYLFKRTVTTGMSLAGRLEFYSMPEPTSGCTLWLGEIDSYGYGRVGWQGKSRKAHRLAWSLVHGDPPSDIHVCHRCDNRACVNIDHLFLGTNQDNTQDKVRKGRHRTLRGDACSWAKLSSRDVAEIRQSAEMQTDLAERFGVSRSTICLVKSGRNWRRTDQP